MAFNTTDHLEARTLFKSRPLKCVAALIAIFLGLVAFFSWVSASVFASFLPMLVGDAIAFGVCYYVYVRWRNQPIRLRCPFCTKDILSTTPWICGVCHTKNTDTDNYSFLSQCKNPECGCAPKAYRCHHADCRKMIYLTEDEDATNYAYCVNSPAETPKADEHAEQLKQFREKKEKTLAELDAVEAERQLSIIRKRIHAENAEKKSILKILEETAAATTELEDAEIQLAALDAEKYKGNKNMLKRRKLAREFAVNKLKEEGN